MELDVEGRTLALVGERGERKTPEKMDAILAERRARWQPRLNKYTSGVLAFFSRFASSPMKGAYLDLQS